MLVEYNTQEENQADTALSAHQSDSRNNPSLTALVPLMFHFTFLKFGFFLPFQNVDRSRLKIKYQSDQIFDEFYF